MDIKEINEQLELEELTKESSKKNNLFSKIYSNSYMVWKKWGMRRKTKLHEIGKENEFMISAAKNIIIDYNSDGTDTIIKSPIYPTTFNRFWKIEHRKEYLNYFIDNE